jgi:uncharacterized damage-inducible protein DinB
MNYYTAISKYIEWMNQKLYAVCADIPDLDQKSNRGAFFKSLHGALNHILVGASHFLFSDRELIR